MESRTAATIAAAALDLLRPLGRGTNHRTTPEHFTSRSSSVYSRTTFNTYTRPGPGVANTYKPCSNHERLVL